MALLADILVLGSTGFVGRIVAEYLDCHHERTSFTFALGARSSAKLADLARELEISAQVPLVVVDVSKEDDLEQAVKSVKVVINTVGPFWKWSTPVVAACARNGVHYVDVTGETTWIKDMIEKYDHLACKKKTVIVHSCGFDSLPSDLAVYLSVQSLKRHLGPRAEVTESVSGILSKGGVSGGTLSTVYTSLVEIPRSKIFASFEDHSISPAAGASSPFPKLLYTVPHVSPRLSGGAFVMSLPNRAIVQRTRGLFEIHPAMADARYGPDFTYEEFQITPNRLLGIGTSLFVYSFFLALRSLRIVQWLFKRLVVDRTYGPSNEEMERGFLNLTNVTSSGKTHAKTVIRMRGDPGYLCSAVMVVECALALLDTSKLTVFAREGGILTPVTAFGEELVTRLEKTERFIFESSIIPP